MTCRVTGCAGRTTGWSRYCSTHKTRSRRHGHPLQIGVRRYHLKPYLQIVQGYRERNPDSEAWGLLQERWGGLVTSCGSLVASYRSGTAMQRNQRQAAEEIVNLDQHGVSSGVIDTAAAIVLMRYSDPHRFRSDNAVYFQVSRRVRSLTETHVGTWYDHATGRVKRVYRDVPPKTALVLGRLLVQQFGQFGLWLHGREEARLRREQERAQAYYNALVALE